MPTPLPPGLLVLHGNRSELLAQTVAGWLRRRPLGPLEEEVLLVQSNGMAEWLKMTLAAESGVCAAARVELPARFLWRLYRQVLGRAAVPPQSPLDKTALTWRLMRLLPTLRGAPGFEPVAGFLNPDLGRGEDRPWQLAQRLADLFDQYQVYRADWLAAWAAGRDELPRAQGGANPVPDDQRWQPALWRALLNELAEGEAERIRPRLHQRVLARLADGSAPATPLPRRVVLFGMTHVPLPTLQALAALAPHSQVLLAIPNPCRFHWADIIDGRELLRAERRRLPLKGGTELATLPLAQMHAHAHPLLAAWGRQGRDFVRQLDAFDDAEQARRQFELPRIDLFDETEAEGAPLLAQVQAHIRDLLPLAEHPHPPVPADDRSIVFHIAHGPMREVEVLHDQLLQLLAHPPGGTPLQPRDVVVMVPDISTMEPAIRAVFGQYGRDDSRHIPFDIADLGARQTQPLVAALDWLLRLPQQRCHFSELRDLLEVPALARRFGLTAEDLPRLTHWMAGAGLRWGLHAEHREALGLAHCGAQHSGWWALRRLLLGYASGGALPADAAIDDLAGASFQGIEPDAEVGGLEAALLGSLAQLLDHLAKAWASLRQPATPADWAQRARGLLADFFQAGDDEERQSLAALDEALDAWLQACDQAEFEAELPLSVLREAWLSGLEAPALNRRFRAGGVTFCTLMPMRAIPFEVVCLLGMNDGDYPRRVPRSDFDLMALPGQGRPGDRSRRDDDRQLMLEALLSARRVLYLSWAGRSVRDLSEQPPSVLVSQLRDYLGAGWHPDVVAQRTTEHPLQPFSRRYFEPGSPFFTYAGEWRQAHASPADEPDDAAAERAQRRLALPDALPAFTPDPSTVLSLDRLTQFLRQPVRSFFRERLGVVFDEEDAADPDDEAFALDGLARHQLRAELLRQALGQLGSQAPSAQWLAAPLARARRAGQLPMGAMGQRVEAELAQDLANLLDAWRQALADAPQTAPRLAVAAEHEGVRVQDWLDELRLPAQPAEASPLCLLLRPQRLCGALNKPRENLRAEHLIGPWLQGLAGAAAGVPVAVRVIGLDVSVMLPPAETEAARQTLQGLLGEWLMGQSLPLAVTPRTALAHLNQQDPAAVYDGGYQSAFAESTEPCLARLYPDFESLSESQDFERLAEALYGAFHQALAQVEVQVHPQADLSALPGLAGQQQAAGAAR